MKQEKDPSAAPSTRKLIANKIDSITPENLISVAIKMPGVKIDRDSFLRKELRGRFSSSQIERSVALCPAAANITREEIGPIAKTVINYESAKVSAVSFAAGLPGGAAVAATLPADCIQYYGFMLRVIQELAYLYGFPDFNLSDEEINAEVMHEIILFWGVMFGVKGASSGVKVLSKSLSAVLSKRLVNMALTKTTFYPIVKKISAQLGFAMTKKIFANGAAKAVPILGGFASGGVTYATFKPCANRLKRCFSELTLCDPNEYQDQ